MKYVKYKSEFAELARRICSETGASDGQLAKILIGQATARSTISDWKKRYPEFGQAVREGKDEFDVGVAEKQLQKRIKGYSYIETVEESEDGPKGIRVVTKKYRKKVGPDTTAIIFYLKNRHPERWQDKKNLAIESWDVKVTDLTENDIEDTYINPDD